MGCGKDGSRSLRLTETLTAVRIQNQLKKERPGAARIGNGQSYSTGLVGGSVPTLVSPPPHHPQLHSKFYQGCTGPCSEMSSAYRVRDPFRKRLRRGQR